MPSIPRSKTTSRSATGSAATAASIRATPARDWAACSGSGAASATWAASSIGRAKLKKRRTARRRAQSWHLLIVIRAIQPRKGRRPS